jgi:hypothetical protein
LPWIRDEARTGHDQTVFVFDPEIGSWVTHRSAIGDLSCIIDGSDVGDRYPLAAVCGYSDAAALVKLDYAERAEDRILEDLTASPFDVLYSTGWQVAENASQRKSWRRPRFIATQKAETYVVRVDTYKDFNEGSPSRSHTLTVDATGTTFWRLTGALEPDGFDWGDGALWGSSGGDGSRIIRASPPTEGATGLGVNRALQLRFTTEAGYEGAAWGITAVMLKYILRKLTT